MVPISMGAPMWRGANGYSHSAYTGGGDKIKIFKCAVASTIARAKPSPVLHKKCKSAALQP